MFLTYFDTKPFFDPEPYSVSVVSTGEPIIGIKIQFVLRLMSNPITHNRGMRPCKRPQLSRIDPSISFEFLMQATPIFSNLLEFFKHFADLATVPVVIYRASSKFCIRITPFLIPIHYHPKQSIWSNGSDRVSDNSRCSPVPRNPNLLRGPIEMEKIKVKCFDFKIREIF